MLIIWVYSTQFIGASSDIIEFTLEYAVVPVTPIYVLVQYMFSYWFVITYTE